MRKIAALTLIAVTGCGGPEWEGSYDAVGHWNLSGPLADGRSAGDAIADLVIYELVSGAPLPDGPKEDLAVALSDLLRPEIRLFIETRAPQELRADGSVTRLLASSLADVTVESEITLEEGGDGVEGTESFRSFQLGDSNGTQKLMPADLGGLEIAAEWNGEVDGGELDIETHEVSIRYGALVSLLADRLIGASERDALETSMLAAIDCNAMAAAVFDDQTEIEVDLVISSFTVSSSLLSDACSSVRSLASDQALGLFALGSGVEVGGLVKSTVDGAPRLESDSNFGGIFRIAPAPIAPKVGVSFSALRAASN